MKQAARASPKAGWTQILSGKRVSISEISSPPDDEDSQGLRLLLIALGCTVLYHGGLLPFTHGNTYDAYIHMFFGDSYRRSWFDVWEPRWYTGFATTSYPPGTHMLIGTLMRVVGASTAFVLVQLVGLLLLCVGVYRFSLLWVTARPAGFAAIAVVLSSSVSETVHLFGQLPTIFSLGIFLNGLPYVYRWLVLGHWNSFCAAVVFAGATTAAHHVTTIFGGILFIVPLGLHALRAVIEIGPIKSRRDGVVAVLRTLGRGVFLAVFMVVVMSITVLAYWVWSINDPITQVPIPHGSRANFLERTDLGFVFFLLPWGTALLFLPYVVYTTLTTRLWPLGLSVLLCFVLGSGGTTPISRAILRGAFDILTLDRFTFWATILILPFLGYMIDGLVSGRSGKAIRAAFGQGVQRILVGGYFIAMTAVSVFAAILPTIQPTQPKFIDPLPIVRFLGEDNHDRWRYLTLGFGDQFAYLSAHSHAQSVDGNYHSARRLPDLTRFSVERLENAKYLGVPGLGSLRQFLVNSESYHLKYVFSNDEFYDPLLHFSGWTRLSRMPNGVSVWEKPDISPLPTILPRRETPPVLATMWAVVPPTMMGLAAIIFLCGLLRRNFGTDMRELRPLVARAPGYTNPRLVRIAVVCLAALTMAVMSLAAWRVYDLARRPASPDEVIAAYLDDLDFRRFEAAYEKLDPATRPPFDEVMFNWRWRGGLIASYGKLSAVELRETSRSSQIVDWRADLNWLTALDSRTEVRTFRTVQRGGRWFIAPSSLRPTQTPYRIQRMGNIDWSVVGRRQPRPETDLHRDRMDRPEIGVWGARLVSRGDRFFVVGGMTNVDVDPAIVSIFAELAAEDTTTLVRQASGPTAGQRLLPAESSGFRVDFEGVLSLEDEEAKGAFDPKTFIPPELAQEPAMARADIRAQVGVLDLYRGVGLNNLRFSEDENGVKVEGLAVNTGTKTATIVRVVVLLLDLEGDPIWTEDIYVDTNIYPGQSARFQGWLPLRGEIRPIAPIAMSATTINGSTQLADFSELPRTTPLPIGDIQGYSGALVQVSSMTYDPLF